MSSQGNVLVSAFGTKGQNLIRFGHNAGPSLILSFVWLPIQHARFLRHVRAKSVANIKEQFEIHQNHRQSLYYFDEFCHLFGDGSEYFSTVLMYCNLCDSFPVTTGDKDAWGRDEKPVVKVKYDYEGRVVYTIGTDTDYGDDLDDIRQQLANEVKTFNAFLREKSPFMPNILATIGENGFSINHNLATATILLHDIDVKYTNELPDKYRRFLSY